MKLRGLFLFNLLLLIFACSSDSDSNDDDQGGNPNDTVLIQEIIYNYAGDNDFYTESFSYDGNKLLSITDTSSDSNEVYSATFEYDNNRLSKISFFEDTALEESITLSYNSENVLTNLEILFPEISSVPFNESITFNSDGSLTIDDTTYTIQNGNVIEENDSGDTLSYAYDNKNSAYKNILDIETIILVMSRAENGFDIYGANNNITELIDNQGTFSEIETFEYSYNSNDYPVSAMLYYDGILDLNVDFIYE
ncbi:hypothetical protein [Winogradskyella flava]|uniref:YD repeat-containing protein n=1 Tax=Winogradskyella flava TaxID=1884876 RepID=A0A842ILB6_9FLAO|nr:hypothetical protein [Winogradskyella flava]MBC2843750.1 hypothetical protein [Winogradskyella flava]